MATLKLFYRTSRKNTEEIRLRARYSVGGNVNLDATTQTIINPKYWNDKTQRLNVIEKPKTKELAGLSIDEQNDYIQRINDFNSDIVKTNNVLSGLANYVTNAYNSYSGTFVKQDKWLQTTIDKYYEELKPKQPEAAPATLNQFIKQYIDELESGKRLKRRSNKKVSEGTIKSIKGFRSQFSNYQTDRNKVVDYEDVTMDFYRDFTNYLLFDRKYSANTVGRMVKVLKTIMYAAKDLKLHNNREIENKDFAANYEEVDNVFLTEERINILYNMDLSNNPAWEKVRDVFVVGCLTGQRVSDYKRINSNMIVTLSNGLEYIELKQEKTDKTVYIPLDWRVKTILDKYNGALPKTYDQKINDYIKKICEKAKFTELVQITQNKAGMEATLSKRFCDMVKTHTARRSLCTNMQQAGCKLSEIIAISGHESEEQLKTYLKLTNKEKAMLADNGYFQRVKMEVKVSS